MGNIIVFAILMAQTTVAYACTPLADPSASIGVSISGKFLLPIFLIAATSLFAYLWLVKDKHFTLNAKLKKIIKFNLVIFVLSLGFVSIGDIFFAIGMMPDCSMEYMAPDDYLYKPLRFLSQFSLLLILLSTTVLGIKTVVAKFVSK